MNTSKPNLIIESQYCRSRSLDHDDMKHKLLKRISKKSKKIRQALRSFTLHSTSNYKMI